MNMQTHVFEQRNSSGAVKKYYHNAMAFLLDSMSTEHSTQKHQEL